MSFTARCLLLATLGLASATPVPAEEPFSFDSAPGRLPKDVVPLDYTVDITPNIVALAFTGSESIALKFRAPAATISFNSLNESLSDVRLDGRPVQSVASDDDRQLTTVLLAAPAAAGMHTLTFTYAGKIETLSRGLFAQSYVGRDGKHGLMLSTKMESTDARRMFPCWDEPAFRATFELSVTVPAQWATVSNMPISKRRVHGKTATTTFMRSPKMPSYLVEFTAGDLGDISAVGQGTKLGVWAVRGREHDGRTALANAQQILADYNDYFGYSYPLPKLDSIAIPGGFTGAMENWGAITYNDQLLLLTPSSTTGTRQTVFSVQAHEMAHQWNGDLVTMAWWDDIWLNESFASWMAAKETAQRHPDWHWWEGRDADKEEGMSADALMASHAIQQHVTDELQATAVFDPQITYRKGQAILRMFEAFVGADAFRSAIRNYIKARAFSNATTVDLWDALSLASGKDIRAILSGWTEQAGYPLVTVAASCDAAGVRTLRLSQRRFLLSGTDPNQSHWSIPLQIRAGTQAMPQVLLLTQDQQSVSAGLCEQPLSLNADAIGFYRVSYDQSTLETNTREFDRLPSGDRIALLDDLWALVQSGTESLPVYLALASAMGSDLDARAWGQIAGALETVEFDERETPGHDAFALYAQSMIRPVFEQLGWDIKPGETPDLQQLRRTIVADLGAWGDRQVIDEARRRFAAFIKDRRAIAPDDQSVILSIVAQYADLAMFEQLHAVARAAKDESELRRYYSALMSVQDSELAEQAARIALSTEIPPQAGSVRLNLIARLAAHHPALAWTNFTRNSQTLLSPFARYAPLMSAQQVPQWFWSGVPLAELETWVRAQVPAEMAPNIERGMQTARFMLAAKQTLLPAADAYVRSRTPARASFNVSSELGAPHPDNCCEPRARSP
jgi:aminopeptidase N